MNQLADVSTELLLQRYENGVRLLRPERATMGHSLASVLKLPLNIYAYDLENNMQFSNDQSTLFCGLVSNHDVVGVNIKQIASKESADDIVRNNHNVVASNSFKILDETLIRRDGVQAGATTLKYPCFNDDNNVIGVFGFSIPWSCERQPNIAESISILMSLDLLNSTVAKPEPVFPGIMIENTYFSKRERDVLYHLVRGKSAKEIGLVLDISFRTVETHISNAKNKIGVHSKSELIERIYHFF